MPSLILGQLVTTGIPADEEVVRSTATPYEQDAPAAMAEDMPVMEEYDPDPNPHLGMVNRTKASMWVEGQPFTPPWLDEVNANADHNDIINRRQSQVGTAAQREAAGQFGHGPLSYAVGIEPVGDKGPAGGLGNDYFVRNERDIQEGTRADVVPPPNYDRDNLGSVMQHGRVNARNAATAGLYNAFWNEGK